MWPGFVLSLASPSSQDACALTFVSTCRQDITALIHRDIMGLVVDLLDLLFAGHAARLIFVPAVLVA